MVKRKKRLEKSINSIEEAIQAHEGKRESAKNLGQEDLVSYYDKEIESLKERKKNREEKLERK